MKNRTHYATRIQWQICCGLAAFALAGCESDIPDRPAIAVEQTQADPPGDAPVEPRTERSQPVRQPTGQSPSPAEIPASKPVAGESIHPPARVTTIEQPTQAPSEPNSPTDAAGGNWPRFRGPNGSGISTDTGLPLEWSATNNIAWKTELPGPGASSPIIFGDHVYVTCYSGYGVDREAPGNLEDLRRHLVCLRRSDGRILWDQTVASQVREQPFVDNLQKHGYASSTPAADVEGVYVFYGASGAAAYSHEGTRKWLRSCGTNTHHYGSAVSPIVVNDLLIIDASVESAGYPGAAALMALDKRTGQEVWQQTGSGGGAYLTPTVVQSNGGRQLVVSQPWGHAMVGLSLENGNKLWQCNVSAYTPTPVVDEDGVLYVLSKNGYAAIRAGGSGDVTQTHTLWEVKRPRYRQASPLYWQGHLYWIPMDGGIACCVSAETGELVYQERIEPHTGPVYASPVVADGRIYYVSRENGTYVMPARPQFELLAHNEIETDDTIFNGSPAISGGRIFLRSDRFLYCIAAETP